MTEEKKAGKTGRGVKTVAATAALVVALSGTAQAQAAADQYAPGGGAAEETALVAQLTVECPENAGGVAGYRLVTTGVESQTSVELADGDGDGVLTGTQAFPRFPPGPQPPAGGAEPITVPDARIVAPDGSTVEQFGPVPLDREEITLAASISFCGDGGDAPSPGAGPDQYGAGGAASDQYGGAGITSAGPTGATVSPAAGVVGRGSAELPETGGAPLAAALGVGVLLVGSGLLLRRARR